MKNKLMLCAFGFVLVFTVVAASAADAPKLTFKFAQTNVPGALETEPSAINNAGVIVGQYEDSAFVWHGYILKGCNRQYGTECRWRTLDDPNGTGGINTGAYGIQYNGTAVVGEYLNNSANAYRGYLYSNGIFTDIVPPGAVSSWAYGINDNRVIVGGYVDSSGVQHGYFLQGGTYTRLDVPGAAYTSANGINNAGYVVLGWGNSSGADEGAICQIPCTTYITTHLNVPGAGSLGSFPNGINNAGDITFVWWPGSIHNQHQSALRTHDGTWSKFENPKVVESYAEGINDKNTFVGGYVPLGSNYADGYVATFY